MLSDKLFAMVAELASHAFSFVYFDLPNVSPVTKFVNALLQSRRVTRNSGKRTRHFSVVGKKLTKHWKYQHQQNLHQHQQNYHLTSATSFTYNKNKRGPKTEPCGTLLTTIDHLENDPEIQTPSLRFRKKAFMYVSKLPPIP